MNNNPKINILILNWNGKNILDNCIKSIRSSTYDNFFITIIDNGSNDNSIKKYFHDEDIEVLKNKKNLGYAKGYNRAFKKILNKKDDYYLILNNDTILLPDTIEKLMNSLRKYGKLNIYSPKILNSNNNRLWFAGGRINFLSSIPYHIGIDSDESNITYKTKQTSFVSGCCMLVNNKIINLLNGFNESYKMYFEDVDFCLRAKKYNISCYMVSDSNIYHNISHSVGGRFSIKKNINKMESFIRFLFYNNNILMFSLYFAVNILFMPVYFLKIVIKKFIYE